jgi:hypothetical protein
MTKDVLIMMGKKGGSTPLPYWQLGDRLYSERYNVCFLRVLNSDHKIAIYNGPMIYTAPYVMLLMQETPLQGQVGLGLGPARLFWDL